MTKKQEYDKKYRDTHKTELKAYFKEYYKKNPLFLKEKERKRLIKLRTEIVFAYGSKCNCCGETIPEFLTIDHINNDGADHRRELFGDRIGHGTGAFYRWIKKNNFSKENLQLLCFNCNCGKYRNKGVCPHG